ncbi:MAG: hypothetical protein JWR84_240 [Caulobacter sp.]|nr:hypothetical protein [Caulobacter sp.]
MALDFHEAAIRCSEEALDPLGASVLPLCPTVVSYAFAAELYLKSLATIGDGLGPAKGHKLNVLFGRLSASLKEDISAAYAAKTGRSRVQMDADLLRLAKTFEDWRYVYEADGRQLHLNLLIAFTLSIYEVSRSVRPDWDVRAYRDERIRFTTNDPSMTVINLGGGTFVHLVGGTPR